MFNPLRLGLAMLLGAGVATLLRAAVPELSWWFVPACAVAMVFVLAALMRWPRWHERNVLIVSAGWLVIFGAAPDALLALIAATALAAVYLVFYVIEDTRRAIRRMSRTRDDSRGDDLDEEDEADGTNGS